MTIQEHEAKVSAARRAAETAEQERGEAVKRHDEAASAAAAAEAAYDSEDTAANGKRVIEARQALDLAALRAGRADRREQEARAALVAAENDLERRRVEERLDDLQKREQAAREAVREARAQVEHANPAAAVAQVLVFTATRKAAAHAASEKARGELETLEQASGELEAKLAALAPDRAAELEERGDRRAELARAELIERTSMEAFKATIAPSVSLILAAERLIHEENARIAAAIERQRVDVERAAQQGIHATPLHEGHKLAHLIHARFTGSPVDVRKTEAHAAELRRIFGDEGKFASPYHPAGDVPSTDKEVIECVLDHAQPQDAARAWRSVVHARLLAAGDQHAINHELRQRAQLRFCGSREDGLGDQPIGELPDDAARAHEQIDEAAEIEAANRRGQPGRLREVNRVAEGFTDQAA